ncbi:MAG TPA: hypothetical protein VJ583_09910 [Nitrososphaeraceae archaeon]|nr:hypothetical protein [Nitrososphaeraceae archaeon]
MITTNLNYSTNSIESESSIRINVNIVKWACFKESEGNSSKLVQIAKFFKLALFTIIKAVSSDKHSTNIK